MINFISYYVCRNQDDFISENNAEIDLHAQ